MFRNQGGSNWIIKATAFGIATSAAGAMTGWLLGYAGALMHVDDRLAIASVLSLLAIGVGSTEALGLKLAIPQCDRETPQGWVHLGPIPWAVLNGAALGCGATSRLGFWAWYLIPAGALLLGDPIGSAVAYTAYGLARGSIPSVLLWCNGRRRRPDFGDIAVWLIRRYPIARRVSAVQVLTAGFLGLLLI